MFFGTGKYTYELIDGWAKLPEGWAFKDACGLTIDSEDNVYVLSRSDHPVMVFDREGNLLTSWGEGLFKRAHGSCTDPDGSVYCTDDGNHMVSKFTPEGRLLLTLGNRDQPSDTGYEDRFNFFDSLSTITRGGSPFNRPTGVALSLSGDIYVSDGYGNARIHKFTPDGTLLFSWGQPGGTPGQFRLPHCVWVDKQDRVWVADRENSRIQIFNAQGDFLTQWADLIRPTDVCMDDEGIVYVCELCLRLSIFSPRGDLLARWGNESGKNKEEALFLAPHTIAVDSRGDIYVGEVALTSAGVDRGSRAVQKFARMTE